MAVRPIPEGYHTVTPYLRVEGVPRLLEFLGKAFDAKVIERVPDANGVLRHAEVKIGDSIVMMGEAQTDKPAASAGLYLYMPDADASYAKALAAGATSIMEPRDTFYGDRNAGVLDPTGNEWWIATHVEDVSQEEMAKRAKKQMK